MTDDQLAATRRAYEHYPCCAHGPQLLAHIADQAADLERKQFGLNEVFVQLNDERRRCWQLITEKHQLEKEVASLRQQLRTAELREIARFEAVPVDEVGQYAEDCPSEMPRGRTDATKPLRELPEGESMTRDFIDVIRAHLDADPELAKGVANEMAIVSRFTALPEHMKTTEWIESCIRYEEHQGIHTYHDCDCGRGLCRSGMCAACWLEMLEMVDHE